MFFEIRILDVVDVILVATLLYHVYKLMRGTVAVRIFAGIFSLYALWFVVKAFKMHLLSAILGQVLGVGVLALFIVFQQEIRKFLLYIGTQYLSNRKFSLKYLYSKTMPTTRVDIEAIVRATRNMSEKKTGALIAIRRKASLSNYEETGDMIGAITSNRLLENIFFKNSPLHDGAVIVENEIIKAARCVLPTSDNLNLPAQYGMRHRAAIGLSEVSDAMVVIVSEETGEISLAEGGSVKGHLSPSELRDLLQRALVIT